MNPIVLYRGRTMVVPLQLAYDVSQDTITSQIRVGRNPESALIATWEVTFKTDGTDGALVLTLDNSITAAITQRTGYMDFKRVSGGEPLNVIDDPIPVEIRDVVTT